MDKACFAHDAAYSDSKDLAKRTVTDKILKNKVFDIAKDPKYDGYQRGLASMAYKFFDSKVSGSGAKLIPQNEQLANELHFINQLLENLKKEEYIQHLKTIFGVLI